MSYTCYLDRNWPRAQDQYLMFNVDNVSPALSKFVLSVLFTCSRAPRTHRSGENPAEFRGTRVRHRPGQDDTTPPCVHARQRGLRPPAAGAGEQQRLGGLQGYQRLHAAPLLPQRQEQAHREGK